MDNHEGSRSRSLPNICKMYNHGSRSRSLPNICKIDNHEGSRSRSLANIVPSPADNKRSRRGNQTLVWELIRTLIELELLNREIKLPKVRQRLGLDNIDEISPRLFLFLGILPRPFLFLFLGILFMFQLFPKPFITGSRVHGSASDATIVQRPDAARDSVVQRPDGGPTARDTIVRRPDNNDPHARDSVVQRPDSDPCARDTIAQQRPDNDPPAVDLESQQPVVAVEKSYYIELLAPWSGMATATCGIIYTITSRNLQSSTAAKFAMISSKLFLILGVFLFFTGTAVLCFKSKWVHARWAVYAGTVLVALSFFEILGLMLVL